VAKGDGKRIGLADGLADAVIAAPSARAEILRVLRPGGVAILGDRRFVKPWPQGTDVWSHHYHGPDNNPQSRDTLARAPYRTQFIVEPRYGPCPQNCVAAGGRVFMAFGHVAWHRREEPWLNTLVCLNGFNGTLLWKRPLKSGIMVDRSTMIATPDTLYLADDESCKLIDPATGKVRHEILPPQDVAGGTFWKWMALDGDTLYALIGAGEAPDRVATWQRKAHGWPWGGISDGYNLRQRDPKTGKMLDRYRWGFAHVLLAIDIRSKRVLWSHKEEEPIDSRSLCLRGGRLYFAHFGRTLACLDASSGTPVWRRTAAKDAKLFQAIGPYRSGHGYVGGWKSTVYLKATDKALYFIGPQVNHLTAVSADDGHFLWKYGAKDLHVVIRDDALYTIGPQRSQGMTKKLHPMTGEVLASYDVHRRACTRSTGTADGILFRASGGAVRLDVATGKPQWISPMRPSCQVGVVVAHGHLYWVPWVCDCNLQMFGTIALAPASPDDASRPATRAACFENGADVPPATLAAAPADWPTYRGDCARRAVSQATLPAQVGLHWTRKPQTAFTPTAPVAVGGLVLLSGSDGIVRALDAATGAARWRAYTGGAVRYPPAVATGRAFVGSGDGWVYCLDAATGKLVWRFRAAPAESRINLYGQLSSAWPVASGVAVHDGVAYLAAGITDFDGTRVLALDAATGAIRWQNTTCGHLDRFSRRGVACQGDLLLHKGKLYLAGGNAVSPGVFDAKTGHCLTPPPTSLGTNAVQGSELHLAGDKVQVTGQPFYSNAANPVWSGKRLEWRPMVVDCANARLELQQRNGAWFLIATGKADPKQKLWEQALPAAPVRWGIAVDAQGRVVVTLRDGRVVCFGTKA
ncbi:MAG: PQQ-binding-like beta-propeller repeat protein, partial [Candidatus Brocadiae bacterium]|nr:PQQ-binding-like beta-propeller repeat protein [Candidatus Brocadiia bacterium]